MSQVNSLSVFINNSIMARRSFAAWFMPDVQELRFIFQNETKKNTSNNLPNFTKKEGFIFYPFDDRLAEPLFLNAQNYFRGYDALHEINYDEKICDGILPEKPQHIQSTAKADYLLAFHQIMKDLKSEKAQKVVLSKIKILPRVEKISPAGLLLKLKQKYPSAFCWIFFAPASGLWMGATPEILLQQSGNQCFTMALAGSRKANTSAQENWSEKEREEQQFVTDFIIAGLKNSDIENIEISQPYTVVAGNIEHIRTDISFENKDFPIDKILASLHPTPAVCGLPKHLAMELIHQAELHQRDYYTGFLGLVGFEHETNLFVNLRCMKIWENHYQLFAGGGITAHSTPEAEWEETELKTRTLSGVIEDYSKI